MSNRSAIITGITGQTGSYLTEHLLNDDYEVYGIIRRSSSFSTERLNNVLTNPKLHLIYGDMADINSLTKIVSDIKPDMFFNMAAMSHVKVSFEIPEYTLDITGTGVIRCLETIRQHSPLTRFYQASSSELFGSSPPPQNEDTIFHPRSPYAVAKLAGYWATVNYREAYGIHGSNGILFNNESERRLETFVTRKITRAVGRIKHGLQNELVLGNLEAKRDWGHARDYAAGIKMILEYEHPDDFVLATGEAHTVREFVEEAFQLVGLDPYKYVKQDEKYFRPTEVDYLLGDAEKAYSLLGWTPTIKFKELVKEMVNYDCKLAHLELLRDGKAIQISSSKHTSGISSTFSLCIP